MKIRLLNNEKQSINYIMHKTFKYNISKLTILYNSSTSFYTFMIDILVNVYVHVYKYIRMNV